MTWIIFFLVELIVVIYQKWIRYFKKLQKNLPIFIINKKNLWSLIKIYIRFGVYQMNTFIKINMKLGAFIANNQAWLIILNNWENFITAIWKHQAVRIYQTNIFMKFVICFRKKKIILIPIKILHKISRRLSNLKFKI